MPGGSRPGRQVGRHQGQVEGAVPAQLGGSFDHAGVAGEAASLLGPAAQVGGGRGRQPPVDVVQAAPGPHRGQGGGQWPAGGMVVVDVVGGDDLGAAAVGEGHEGVVAGRVERVAVVPQLHHHVAGTEQGLEPAQLGRGPGRPVGDQGGGDDPLAAPGEHHPVVGVRAGGGTHGDPGSPPGGRQVGERPRSDGGEGLEVHRGAPLFPAGQMGHREGPAQPGVAGGIPGQDQEWVPSGSATPFCGRVSPRDSSAPNTVGIPTARAASAKRTTPYMPS